VPGWRALCQSGMKAYYLFVYFRQERQEEIREQSDTHVKWYQSLLPLSYRVDIDLLSTNTPKIKKTTRYNSYVDHHHLNQHITRMNSWIPLPNWKSTTPNTYYLLLCHTGNHFSQNEPIPWYGYILWEPCTTNQLCNCNYVWLLPNCTEKYFTSNIVNVIQGV